MTGGLEVNYKIELEVKTGPYQGIYQSKVVDIKDCFIEILAPFRKGEVLPLRKNIFIEVFYTDDTAAYKFDSTVVKRMKNPFPVLVIKAPLEIKRIQRRDFFRLEIIRQVNYCIINRSGEQETKYKESCLLDISGGGIKLKVDEKMQTGIFLRLYLDIEGIKKIPVKGRVVRFYKNHQGNQAAGIEFVHLNTGVRDTIVGWIFEKQAEMRKKGII